MPSVTTNFIETNKKIRSVTTNLNYNEIKDFHKETKIEQSKQEEIIKSNILETPKEDMSKDTNKKGKGE